MKLSGRGRRFATSTHQRGTAPCEGQGERQLKAIERAGLGEGTEAVVPGDGIERTPTFTPTGILD